MNNRFVLTGTLLAAVIIFIWQAISNVAIPWHSATMTTWEPNSAVSQAIRAASPENGLYVSTEGIMTVTSFNPDAPDKTKLLGSMLAKQFVIDLVAGLLLALLVSRLPVMSTTNIAVTVLISGMAVGILNNLAMWNWYGFPMDYTLVQIADLAICWLLVGLALGWLRNRQLVSA